MTRYLGLHMAMFRADCSRAKVTSCEVQVVPSQNLEEHGRHQIGRRDPPDLFTKGEIMPNEEECAEREQPRGGIPGDHCDSGCQHPRTHVTSRLSAELLVNYSDH